MSISLVQLGGAAAVGTVAGGAISMVNGYDLRMMAISAAVGGTSSLAMYATKETTGNGGLAALAGIGTGAVMGGLLLSLKAGKVGFMPTGAGAALGAVIGGFSMLAAAGVVSRLAEPQP